MTFATYHPHTSRFPENKALDYARLADCETQKKMRFPLLVRFATEAMRLGNPVADFRRLPLCGRAIAPGKA
jgi:hypothetical protein